MSFWHLDSIIHQMGVAGPTHWSVFCGILFFTLKDVFNMNNCKWSILTHAAAWSILRHMRILLLASSDLILAMQWHNGWEKWAVLFGKRRESCFYQSSAEITGSWSVQQGWFSCWNSIHCNFNPVLCRAILGASVCRNELPTSLGDGKFWQHMQHTCYYFSWAWMSLRRAGAVQYDNIYSFQLTRKQANDFTFFWQTTATHQLKNAVTSVAFSGRALLLSSLCSTQSGDSSMIDTLYDLIVTSLSNALLGMDANDPPKTVATMQLIGSIFSNVSIYMI